MTLDESNGALGTPGSGRREPVILLFLTVVLLALIGSLTAQLLLSRLHERQLARLPGSAPTL